MQVYESNAIYSGQPNAGHSDKGEYVGLTRINPGLHSNLRDPKGGDVLMPYMTIVG